MNTSLQDIPGSGETGRLRAGPVNVQFDSGGLRYLCFQDQEMLRGIAFYIRDANWDTIPNQVLNPTLVENEAGFQLSYDVLSKQGDIEVLWNCNIGGNEDQLTFEISGKSRSRFMRNRMGFVVLHPNILAGEPLTVTHTNNTLSEGRFPELISPHQPYQDIKRIAWETNRVKVSLDFEGDIFEMEDQRNWLDASYKTYCTPLELPFPVTINQGDTVHQKITVRFEAKNPMLSGDTQKELIEGKAIGKLPGIGLTANEASLDEQMISQLEKLKLSHLRIEARTFQPDWQQSLVKQCRQAMALSLPVELMLYSGAGEIKKNLQAIKSLPGFDALLLKSVMCFDLEEKSNSKQYLETAADQVKSLLGPVPLGGGTDYFFTELNRNRPHPDRVDFVFFSVHPQVHAFDDASILETPSTFNDIGKSAAGIASGKEVHITPITLAGRLNPNATDPGARILTARQRIDPRQQSQLAALWTLASIKNIAASGVEQVTFFQTAGPEGVLDETGVFPLYKVLNMLSCFHDYQVVESHSSDPLLFDGMVFQKDGVKYYLMFNLTDRDLEVGVGESQVALAADEIACFNDQLQRSTPS